MPLPALQQSPPKLKVRGATLPLDLATCVMKIAIKRDLNLPGQFTVQLLGLDLNQSILTIFGIGQEVVIQMDSESKIQTPTLVGEIAGLEPEFRSDGFLGLTVWGYDRLHHLQRSQKTRSYTRLKDSQIATNIAAEAGLIVQVKDSEVIHDYLLQANQTDLAFLQERAQLIHYAMFVEDKTLFFQPIDSTASPSSTLTLGKDLLEFYPRLSSVSQKYTGSSAGVGYDQKGDNFGQELYSQNPISARRRCHDRKEVRNIHFNPQRSPCLDKE
jgi:uncharacterized protein